MRSSLPSNPRALSRGPTMADLPASAAFLLLAFFSVADADTDPGDLAAMRALSAALGAERDLGWSLSSDLCSSWVGTATIQVGNRSLTGSLAADVRNLTALVRLELQENRLAGPLPSLAGLASLRVLLLHHNLFSSVPGDFFAGLSSLQAAFLDDNPFAAWPLPADLCDAATLVNFSANSANVTGPLPDFVATAFPGLDHLGLAFNLLSGPVPQDFATTPFR